MSDLVELAKIDPRLLLAGSLVAGYGPDLAEGVGRYMARREAKRMAPVLAAKAARRRKQNIALGAGGAALAGTAAGATNASIREAASRRKEHRESKLAKADEPRAIGSSIPAGTGVATFDPQRRARHVQGAGRGERLRAALGRPFQGLTDNPVTAAGRYMADNGDRIAAARAHGGASRPSVAGSAPSPAVGAAPSLKEIGSRAPGADVARRGPSATASSPRPTASGTQSSGGSLARRGSDVAPAGAPPRTIRGKVLGAVRTGKKPSRAETALGSLAGDLRTSTTDNPVTRMAREGSSAPVRATATRTDLPASPRAAAVGGSRPAIGGSRPAIGGSSSTPPVGGAPSTPITPSTPSAPSAPGPSGAAGGGGRSRTTRTSARPAPPRGFPGGTRGKAAAAGLTGLAALAGTGAALGRRSSRQAAARATAQAAQRRRRMIGTGLGVGGLGLAGAGLASRRD